MALLSYSKENSFYLLRSMWFTQCKALPPAWTNSTRIWSVPGDFYLCSFRTAISTSKELGSGTNGSAARICVCLTSLIPYMFNSWEKQFLHLLKIWWEPASRLSFSSFSKFVLGWWPFSNSFASLYFSSYCLFQTRNFSVPERSTSVAFYIVHIVPIYLARFLQTVQSSLLPLIQLFWTLLVTTGFIPFLLKIT